MSDGKDTAAADDASTTDQAADPSAVAAGSDSADPGSDAPAPPPTRTAPRGPRLVPGAAVAGGRYRLISNAGGARGLQFWHARDINLDRDVALTFVDAEQIAAPTAASEPADADGPQAVLSRTLRIGHLNSAGAARVLDVIRGSSGGIIVAEWVPGSSLSQVSATEPSPRGAARAVRALAAAAEAAHRTGGALSIDSPDRIRISTNGDAVLAFPGTLAGDDKTSDVRGLGAVLYALLLDRWPLTADGSATTTTKQGSDLVGGMHPALPDDQSATPMAPIEPRRARPQIPFEISAVAARAISGDQGIRTAATIQHVLDQATVADLPTTAVAPLDSDGNPIAPAEAAEQPAEVATETPVPLRENKPLLVGLGIAALLVVIALIIMLSKLLGGSAPNSDIDAILTTSSATNADAPGAPIPLQTVSVVDFSNQPPDPSTNVTHVISGDTPSWQTDRYKTSADFGGLKPGIGLMFNLGGNRTVRSVTVATPNPGFHVELRTAPAVVTSLNATTKVADGDVDTGATTITVANPKSSPFLLVWIDRLAPSQTNYGQYEAIVQKISMKS